MYLTPDHTPLGGLPCESAQGYQLEETRSRLVRPYLPASHTPADFSSLSGGTGISGDRGKPVTHLVRSHSLALIQWHQIRYFRHAVS